MKMAGSRKKDTGLTIISMDSGNIFMKTDHKKPPDIGIMEEKTIFGDIFMKMAV